MADGSKNTFASLLRDTFIDVYSSDSYDVTSGRFNLKTAAEHNDANFFSNAIDLASMDTFDLANMNVSDRIRKHRKNKLVLITSFFGLPNECELQEDFDKKKLINNLFGNQEGWKRYPILFKNLFFVPFITAQNTLKLFTEFLPLFAFYGLIHLADLIWKQKSAVKYLTIIPGFFGHVFNAIRLVGRAITSPIDSVRASWFNFVNPNPDIKKTPLKIIGGIMLATLSIAISVTAFSILFSVLAPTMGLGMAKLAGMAPHASALFASIGNHVMLPILGKLAIGMNPIVAGFTTVVGASIGLALTTIGPILNDLLNFARDKWKKSSLRPIKLDPIILDEIKLPDTLAASSNAQIYTRLDIDAEIARSNELNRELSEKLLERTHTQTNRRPLPSIPKINLVQNPNEAIRNDAEISPRL